MDGIGIGILFWSAALIVIISVIRDRRKVKAMQQWKQVTGLVIENWQEPDPDGQSAQLFQTLVFQYEVASRLYTHTLHFNYDNFMGLNRWVAQYQPGDSIEVIYDPVRPSDSTLAYFNQDLTFAPISIAFLLLLGGTFSLLTALAL
jgi:hypothetical protein